jgi:SAM-dependent methyltransferase
MPKNRLIRSALGPFRRTAPLEPEQVDGLPVTDEAVTWALRLLIGRDPVNQAESELHKQHRSLADLRTSFMRTQEFAALQARVAERPPAFAIPPFLLRPPADPSIPWMSGEPTLTSPSTQLCTAAQFDDPDFAELVATLQLAPGYHRKLWEHGYVVSVLRNAGLLKAGRRAIVFGCGRERLPAYFASMGLEVLATDAPAEETFNQGWAGTGQFAEEPDDLFVPSLLDRGRFDRLVSFRAVDMNAIPQDLAGRFDACWSTCALEHLGSLRHGLDFIENSLSVLRPGGIAVHTTEFNLGSNDETLESPGLSVYRRRDIEALAARLAGQGHEVFPLNFHPGNRELDEVIDLPPYGSTHLKLAVQRMTCTSIGVAIRKKA